MCHCEHFHPVVAAHFAVFFFSSRRRHTRLVSDWSSDVCSSDLTTKTLVTYLGTSHSSIQRWHRRRCPVRRLPFRFRAHLRLTERHFRFCRWENCRSEERR